MQSTNTPKRLILRFHERHWLEEQAILQAFFESFGSLDDYFSHRILPNTSNKMHVVLDVHCSENPSPSPDDIIYEVFKVVKITDL